MHERTRAALMGRRSDTVILVIASGIALALAAVTFLWLHLVVAAIFVLFVPPAAIVLVLRVVVGPMRVNAELARLASLPFAFDREKYLELLAEERASIALVLVASFASAPPEELQALVETMGRAANLRDARWTDHATLRLDAPDIQTRFESTPNQPSYVATRDVHLWFSRSAIPMLLALHARSPMARVTVDR